MEEKYTNWASAHVKMKEQSCTNKAEDNIVDSTVNLQWFHIINDKLNNIIRCKQSFTISLIRSLKLAFLHDQPLTQEQGIYSQNKDNYWWMIDVGNSNNIDEQVLLVVVDSLIDNIFRKSKECLLL